MTHQDELRRKDEITTSPRLENKAPFVSRKSRHLWFPGIYITSVQGTCAWCVCHYHGDVHTTAAVNNPGLSPRIPEGMNTNGAIKPFRCFNIFINFLQN